MKEKWKEFKEKCRGLKQHIKEMEGKKKAAIVACAVALCLAVGGAGSLAATYGDGGNASTTKTADKKETTKRVTAKAEPTEKSSKDEKKTTAKKVDAKTEDTKKSDETKTDKEEKKTDAKSDSKDSKSEDKKKESGSSSKSDSGANKDNNSGNSSKPSSGNSNSPVQKPSGGNSNSPVQKPSGGNNNSGNTSKPSTPETKPSVPVHTHNWVEQTHTVHHEATGHNEQYVVSEAWDEQKSEPIYEMQLHWYCNTCGADITSDPVGHLENTDCGGYHSNYIQVQTGTNNYTVHHDAVYGTRWVQDSAAWDETVSDGYACSGCGATK